MTTSRIGNDARGFTLLELIVVMSILVTIVALSSPAFRRTYQAMLLNDAVQKLVLSAAYARERAVFENKSYRLVFFYTDRAWQIEGDDRKNRRTVLPEGFRLNGDSDSAVFFPNGSSTELRIELEGPDRDMRRITFNPVSAGASVEKI